MVTYKSATHTPHSPNTHVAFLHLLNHNSCRGAADDLPPLHYIREHPQCRNVISCYFLFRVQYFIRIFPFNSRQHGDDCSQNSSFSRQFGYELFVFRLFGLYGQIVSRKFATQALLVCNRDATLLNDICALCFR